MAEEKEVMKLAEASGWGDIAGWPSGAGNFYMPNTANSFAQMAGITPDKLIIPRDYHKVIEMCYNFYQIGGSVSTVINRLTEMAMTDIKNGQRKTTDEANAYFDAVLHRAPSRLNRFIHTMALEYFLSGMVLPRIEWEEKLGEDISPKLKRGRTYVVPVCDLYPPTLVRVEWPGWGKKNFYLQIPAEDVKTIKNGGKIKNQQLRYEMWRDQYPDIFNLVKAGTKEIKIDSDAILRKEVSFTQYPTPFLFNVLEGMVFKQQLRRMDYAVASRIITAILLVQEGSDEFPITEDNRGNLDALKAQIAWYSQHPEMAQRLFPLFSNHTTKLTWVHPDVQALLDQDKYRQTNEEIAEGLGFAKILVTGESRNAQASEVSTWAIQPMMEELRAMVIEWLTPVYEQAADFNGFRYVPQPAFTPIRLQDFIKTAAVFAQLFKEGNISRTTRDFMSGLDFEAETELMKDERVTIKELLDEGEFGDMPYNIQAAPGMGGAGGGIGRPASAPNKGGRPTGSQNVPVNKRNRGVKPPGQQPTSRVKASFEPLPPEKVFEMINAYAENLGVTITLDDINDPEVVG